MKTTYNIHEAKTKLSAILKQVEAGQTILLCRDHRPVARIVKEESEPFDRLKPHPELQGQILYDPTEPLQPDEWPEEYQ
jgi:antitoxin (DNA-binding transcriptional repressor) of toxin-antitoxin stability system